MSKINGNRVVFGFINCAAFNVRAQGDSTWFLTREARDGALAKKREWAIGRGLSESASRSGIYPVKTRASKLTEDERDALEILAIG